MGSSVECKAAYLAARFRIPHDRHVAHLEGHVDSRFRPVADAFLDGFEAGRDVGAALAVIVDGQTVVDVWHGHADRKRTRPWQQDTLVCMFSVTKAMTAVCLLQAVDRGLLELDTPIVEYWPEFAGDGRDAITLRHLMCHQAGMVGFREPVDRELLYDWPGFIAALENEAPWWEPGSRHGYHARTYGFLLGELLRRVAGISVGEWFRREVAVPLDLDFAIGLPSDDLARCADVLPARMRPGALDDLPSGAREMMRDFNDLSTPTGAAFQNPAMGPGYMNSERFRQAEIPAANGHGTARAVAGMYADAGSIVSAELMGEATSIQALGNDEVLKSPTCFGLGFMLNHNDSTSIGVREGTFGHAGAGGSLAFHDPAERLSLCFAMNQLEVGIISGGASARSTTTVVYDCL